jgi:hypothetical protein
MEWLNLEGIGDKKRIFILAAWYNGLRLGVYIRVVRSNPAGVNVGSINLKKINLKKYEKI